MSRKKRVGIQIYLISLISFVSGLAGIIVDYFKAIQSMKDWLNSLSDFHHSLLVGGIVFAIVLVLLFGFNEAYRWMWRKMRKEFLSMMRPISHANSEILRGLVIPKLYKEKDDVYQDIFDSKNMNPKYSDAALKVIMDEEEYKKLQDRTGFAKTLMEIFKSSEDEHSPDSK